MENIRDPAPASALAEANRDLVRLGLNHGTAGNVSVRCEDDTMLITPSGIPPERTTAEMMARVSLRSDGEDPCWQGLHRPSSEWRLHRDILLKRENVGAVVHTHAPFATVLAVQQREIPAVHYMIAAFGVPKIRCTPYAPFGTHALSVLVVEHLGEGHGVLLGNHGMVVTGRDLAQAMWRAVELEALARLTVVACSTGSPVVLPDDEIARTIERFADYGLAADSRS